ncbi:AraC family transcriptional regulator [Deinococcus sp. S9]|uniref:AraC family transcriptional regulator n=1 Tax=Deinococcus sp. S9 TaxID=2545754 RepID=UPI001F0E4408|nr:AraC family transcriptional regulator [Deinococcus sp. S9]
MTPTAHTSPQANPFPSPGEADLARLARLLRAHTPYDGSFELRLPGVHAVRRSRTNTELVHGFYHPSLCIVARGAKSVLLGTEIYKYDASQMLVVSVDLPVASQVTRASFAEPFLCLKLDLDPRRITELAFRVYPHGLPKVRENRGVCVGQADASIVNAATRLLELMADERDAELLAPLVVEEILIRLLRGPMGSRVAQLGEVESSMHRIARAVDWVRAHFDQPMNVQALAELVHMSPSAFHAHFRAVTSLSPLQYQKVLRLREARRLMLMAKLDVGTAGRQVGYASASQFSREYHRLFGRAPTQDIAQLREHASRTS